MSTGLAWGFMSCALSYLRYLTLLMHLDRLLATFYLTNTSTPSTTSLPPPAAWTTSGCHMGPITRLDPCPQPVMIGREGRTSPQSGHGMWRELLQRKAPP